MCACVQDLWEAKVNNNAWPQPKYKGWGKRKSDYYHRSRSPRHGWQSGWKEQEEEGTRSASSRDAWKEQEGTVRPEKTLLDDKELQETIEVLARSIHSAEACATFCKQAVENFEAHVTALKDAKHTIRRKSMLS